MRKSGIHYMILIIVIVAVIIVLAWIGWYGADKGGGGTQSLH